MTFADHLGDALDAYVKNRFGFRVKVIRNSRREGLIRSRMIGANIATGEALVFLDSHVEVADDWLEPLLHEIRKSESTVASPMVDLIDKETFEYKYNVNEVFGVGGFDWNMQFGWHALPESQRLGRKHAHEPAKTPVMTSGMFAISKKYFEYIGSFDGAMVSRHLILICFPHIPSDINTIINQQRVFRKCGAAKTLKCRCVSGCAGKEERTYT